MIDGVGKTGLGRIELGRVAPDGSAPVAKAGNATTGSGKAVGGAVAELVAGGPPVDADKVAAIRTAIAEGRYPVDPEKIAERMIALDLPHRG